MKKIEKNILLAIVIAGLLISTTFGVSAIDINKGKNTDSSLNIKKIETDTLTCSKKIETLNIDINSGFPRVP